MAIFSSLFFKKVLSIFTGSNGMLYILAILLAIIILPNYNFIIEKLGFETKNTLVKKLETEKGKVEVISEKNKDLNETVDNLKESKDNAEKTVIDVIKKEKIIEANSSDIVKRKNEKIENIKKEVKPKSQTINQEVKDKIEHDKLDNQLKEIDKELAEFDRIEKEKAISEVQIIAIWEAYCKYDNNPKCLEGNV